MARYIDADKFAERIKLSPAFKNVAFEGDLLQRVVLDLLGNAPTADVEEVKHGEWKASVMGTGAPHCSLCNGVAPLRYIYCPHCGAKMGGRRDT